VTLVVAAADKSIVKTMLPEKGISRASTIGHTAHSSARCHWSVRVGTA